MKNNARKLNAGMRLKLCKLAITKFLDLEKREKLTQMREELAQQIFDEFETKIRPNEYIIGLVSELHKEKVFRLPYYVSQLSSKKHTLPDGKNVFRDTEVETFQIPNSFSYLRTTQDYQKYAAGSMNIPLGENRLPDHSLELPGEIFRVHNYHSGSSKLSVKEKGKKYNWKSCEQYNWISFKIAKMIYQVVKFTSDINDAENEMRRGIISFILNSKTFGDVVEFWPEATEIEDELFGQGKTGTALLALNDEQKSAICKNMASRGVQSKVCAAA